MGQEVALSFFKKVGQSTAIFYFKKYIGQNSQYSYFC